MQGADGVGRQNAREELNLNRLVTCSWWSSVRSVGSLLTLAIAPARCAWGQPVPSGAEPLPDGPVELAPEGFFDTVFIFAGGWIGILILMLLLALSITAAYLVIDHLLTIRRGKIIPEGLGEHVRELLLSGMLVEANQACHQKPSLLSFVLLNGIAEIEGGWVMVEKAIEDAVAEQAARLFRKIEYLSVIGNIAPMLGLLGTVTGMILAFQRVAVTQGTAGAADLAEGIYQALVTTVGGLLVAIPSLGAFAILRNRVDELVAEAAYVAQHAFTPLKRRRGGGKTVSSPPPPPSREAR